jgi:hypothetical protein
VIGFNVNEAAAINKNTNANATVSLDVFIPYLLYLMSLACTKGYSMKYNNIRSIYQPNYNYYDSFFATSIRIKYYDL